MPGDFLAFNMPYESEGKTISARAQAETFLTAALKLNGQGYKKIGLTYSANHDQTTKIKNTYDTGDWRTGTSGANQAAVLHEAELLMETERFESLQGVVQWVPITTMVGEETKFNEGWIKEDQQNITNFMQTENNILLGWQNQLTAPAGRFAIGGGVAKGLDSAQKANEKQLMEFQAKLKQLENTHKPKMDEPKKAVDEVLKTHLAKATQEKPKEQPKEEPSDKAKLEQQAKEIEAQKRKDDAEKFNAWRIAKLDKKGRYWKKVSVEGEPEPDTNADVTIKDKDGVYKKLEPGIYTFGNAAIRLEDGSVKPINHEAYAPGVSFVKNLFSEFGVGKKPFNFRENYSLALDLMRYQGTKEISIGYNSPEGINHKNLMTLLQLAEEKGLKVNIKNPAIEEYIAKNPKEGQELVEKVKQVNERVDKLHKDEEARYKAQLKKEPAKQGQTSTITPIPDETSTITPAKPK